MLRTGAGRVIGLLIFACAVARPLAQATDAPGSSSLLAVPYLAQRKDLCGGAALAMVLRYWHTHDDVVPEDFASLIDPSAHGIAAVALVRAAQARGWTARSTDADGLGALSTAIEERRPVIALIDPDGAGRTGGAGLHYVVVVGITASAVIFHDPARSPFRELSRDAFDRSWLASGRWMLTVVPRSSEPPVERPVEPPADSPADPPANGPCAALVARGVALARANERAEAETGLQLAVSSCPRDPAAWRELAGLRFVQSRWSDAARLATVARQLAPGDTYAWRLEATSEYLEGRTVDALGAWNEVQEPRMDVVRVQGARRTRVPVITRLLDLPPRVLLTPDRFERAARRLELLPAANATTLRFEPTDDGRARVDAVVVEGDPAPFGKGAIAIEGLRAAILGEMHVDVPNATGSGERWMGAWRWAAGRPAVSFGLAIPALDPLQGVISIDGSWQRETYGAAVSGGAPTSMERRHAGVRLTDWAPHQWRWEGGFALDRFEAGEAFAVDGAIEKRAAGNRVAWLTRTSWWVVGAGAGFATVGSQVAWRSTPEPTHELAWSAVAGLEGATLRAPRLVWPGAGTGIAREPLLRAHPLIRQDAIDGDAFGRVLAHATVESERRVVHTILASVGVAAFVDTAQAWRRGGGAADSGWLTDAGVGLRLHLGTGANTIRIDAASGLRDSARALSVGWQQIWR